MEKDLETQFLPEEESENKTKYELLEGDLFMFTLINVFATLFTSSLAHLIVIFILKNK